MKLHIENGIIILSDTGSYSIPDDIPNPVMIQRFEIVNDEISIVNKYIGMTNVQLLDEIREEKLQDEFVEDIGIFMSALIFTVGVKANEIDKTIIGKENITDNELFRIRKSYERKVEIAKNYSGGNQFKFQAEAFGMTMKEFADMVILKHNEMQELSDMTFDAVEAERLKIQLLITTKENGLGDAKNALEILTLTSGQHWIDKVSG